MEAATSLSYRSLDSNERGSKESWLPRVPIPRVWGDFKPPTPRARNPCASPSAFIFMGNGNFVHVGVWCEDKQGVFSSPTQQLFYCVFPPLPGEITCSQASGSLLQLSKAITKLSFHFSNPYPIFHLCNVIQVLESITSKEMSLEHRPLDLPFFTEYLQK